jgi:hypothetical protein
MESGCCDFKVVEPLSLQEEHNNDDCLPILPATARQQSIHIVKPEFEWCSCGVWQDILHLCCHACAVYRQWKEKEFIYILQQHLIHPYYSCFDSVQIIYKNNIYPACLDSVQYDCEKKPPASCRCQPGQPAQVKRICRQSKFLNPEESPITCSYCGQRCQ